MKIQAIAFDLDGTLIDSSTDLAHAANHARASQNLPPLPVATVENYVGDGAAVMVSRALADSKDADYLGTPEQDAGIAAFDAHYLANLDTFTRYYTGMQAILYTLKQRGYPLALVTNKPERFTLPLLERLGAAGIFDVVVAGDTLPQRKPAAEPLLHVAQRFGIDPASLLMIGDSANDALTARNAGCPVWLVPHGYADPHQFDCDRVLKNGEELLELLP